MQSGASDGKLPPVETTVRRLRDRIIEDGIAEVTLTYEEDDPRRLGAIEGFELCRSLKTREAFEKVLLARTRRELRHISRPIDDPLTDEERRQHWHSRYGTLQVEWVLKCLIVAAWWRIGEPLSGRAARKVSEVLSCMK
jgi:hypothetical protein